jgi:hypothetical protein
VVCDLKIDVVKEDAVVVVVEVEEAKDQKIRLTKGTSAIVDAGGEDNTVLKLSDDPFLFNVATLLVDIELLVFLCSLPMADIRSTEGRLLEVVG